MKIVVPYIPGGSTDTAGRLLAGKLTALLGQQVLVENRGGGNTIIGMELGSKPIKLSATSASDLILDIRGV